MKKTQGRKLLNIFISVSLSHRWIAIVIKDGNGLHEIQSCNPSQFQQIPPIKLNNKSHTHLFQPQTSKKKSLQLFFLKFII